MQCLSLGTCFSAEQVRKIIWCPQGNLPWAGLYWWLFSQWIHWEDYDPSSETTQCYALQMTWRKERLYVCPRWKILYQGKYFYRRRRSWLLASIIKCASNPVTHNLKGLAPLVCMVKSNILVRTSKAHHSVLNWLCWPDFLGSFLFETGYMRCILNTQALWCPWIFPCCSFCLAMETCFIL